MRILIVGASGYIGGRLVPLLRAADYDLVLLGRDIRPLVDRFPSARVVQGDLDPMTLPAALEGVDIAYYLAHSMGPSGGSTEGFAERDLRAAGNFARAAAAAGVSRIVYLGGLGADDDPSLSHHLTSRHETGAELARHGVPVTEFRAAIVIGSGSASFEILRHLTERLPVMITPRWVGTRCQPIAIHDVLDYLVAAAARPEVTGIVEIGGPDVLSYGGVMMAYARLRGLRRLMIPVPVLTPRLSSYWVNLVSPVPADIARPLIEGLRNEVVVRDPGPAARFGLTPLSLDEALRRAIGRTDRHAVESTWFDAYAATDRDSLPASSSREGMIVDRRAVVVAAPPERVFAEVERVGGATGWPYANGLWRMRGVADRVVGGVGMRLGRRDPDQCASATRSTSGGSRPSASQSSSASGRRCGCPAGRGSSTTRAERRRSADEARPDGVLRPRGLAGLAYWYGLSPVHPAMFRGMVRELASRAAAAAA